MRLKGIFLVIYALDEAKSHLLCRTSRGAQTPPVGTSEGLRDELSEEQLSLLVWARWVVRMLPYYCAQLRGVQQVVIRGEKKASKLIDILRFTAQVSDFGRILRLS